MEEASAEVAAYIGRWRPSSVSPQAAAFARDVITKTGPEGRERAKNLLWAAGKLADYAIGLGLDAVPEVVLHPSVAERFTRCAPALSGVARRTLRTNLRFIGRRVVPQLYPADLPLPRERAKAPYSLGEIDGFLALADAQPTAERRMRAAGLICLGAGAGLIRSDLRDVRGTDVTCRSSGVLVTVRGARPRAVPVLGRYHVPLLAAARSTGDALICGGTDPGRRNPAGGCEQGGFPPAAAYRHLAFSPDGRTLWASPSSRAADSPRQYCSDVLDPVSGAASPGPGWDTGVTAHPGGGLVATLRSDQGATLVVFARAGRDSAPAPMRVLRRALILDADGYEAPVFSADGRLFAVRGNAYENSLALFEFPSLKCVLATTLGMPSPGYPYPQGWLEQMRAWSRRNIAFGARPGVLWAGSPTGSLVEVDLDNQHAAGHGVLAGSL